MNAMEAYEYADILQARFPKGEAAIATNAQYSYEYARDILKAPFRLGEKKISGIEVIHKKYRKLFPKKKKPAFFLWNIL